MKKSLLFLMCLTMMAALMSCGSDEPEISRTDREMKVKALTHVLNNATGEATMTMGDENTYTMHLTALKADMRLNIVLNGSKQVLTVNNVPLTREGDYTYRFNFDLAQTDNPAVTNLKGLIDMPESLAIFQCDVNGHHVCVNIPDVFFNQVSLAFNYSDGSQSSYSNSNWITQIASNGQKADLLISDIEIAKDFKESGGEFKRLGQFLKRIKAENIGLEVTATGYRITASQTTTETMDGTGLIMTYTINNKKYPYYIIRDLVNDVNLITGTMTANFVVRHVLEYSNQGANAGEPTRWDDINVTATGKAFKDHLFN